MLVMLLVTVALSALAVYAIAKLMREALERLGLDLMSVLLWLGLAEWPAETSPPREQHTREVSGQPARGRLRSPHRGRARSASRRRSAAAGDRR